MKNKSFLLKKKREQEIDSGEGGVLPTWIYTRDAFKL